MLSLNIHLHAQWAFNPEKLEYNTKKDCLVTRKSLQNSKHRFI